MTLGQKLRQARQARGLTQAQVVGDRITRNMLSQLENDLASPSVATLEYLASVLDVKLSWLLADEQEQARMERRQQLHARLRAGDYAGCLALAPDDGSVDDEQALAFALAACGCAESALGDEQFAQAASYAAQGLGFWEKSVYAGGQLRVQLLAVQARCAQAQNVDAEAAVAAYQSAYCAMQLEAQHHMLLAHYHLTREHVQAAEHEIWSIAELPEGAKAEYLILRGCLAARKEQYQTAMEYLRQAEAMGPLPKLLERELCRAMELSSRELQDYKSAYEYAARQLKL